MSRYKLKIILWYTGLLSGILIIVFGVLYTLLGYQLRQNVDKNLLEKIQWIEKLLRDTQRPPRCDDDFLDYIVSRRRYNFYDIREYTDVVDDKYVLLVYCGDTIMYLSRKYSGLKPQLERLQIKERETPTVTFANTPFSMAAIYKVGYTIYVGYELSTIRSLQKRILQIFSLVLPFGIILSILCGYVVTQRSLKVIKQITNTASRITSKNLSERIPVPSDKDEITQLILTLNLMIDRLEKSFTMAQQFSHDAAHEIRTPLTIVRGEIEELLKDDRCPENISNALESLLEEIQYLSSVAEKLLLIHSLDTGEIEYHFKIVDLSKIIQEIYEDALVLSAEKQLTIELKKNDSVVIKGNEELLTRLLWNVIDNAIKYSPQGGKVSIALEEKRDFAVIRVADTGVGIPAEDINKIFDRFYRVDKSRSRELGGTGLGLAISKWIVDLHKGQIRVESEVGVSSEFIITLPSTESHPV